MPTVVELVTQQASDLRSTTCQVRALAAELASARMEVSLLAADHRVITAQLAKEKQRRAVAETAQAALAAANSDLEAAAAANAALRAKFKNDVHFMLGKME